jgi:galactosylceramidase
MDDVGKISEEHAPCTRPRLPHFNVSAETVIFELEDSIKTPTNALALWFSNYNTDNNGGKATLFEQQKDIAVVTEAGSKKRLVTLHVPVGSHFTISTVRTAVKAAPPAMPASQPSFPLPYADGFQSKPVSQEAPFLADQIGAFEVHYESTAGVVPAPGSDASASANKVMKQMVPQLPIGWSDHGSNGPMTLIGMREWADVSVAVDFKLPPSAPASAAGCVATRVDQMWKNCGIAFCLSASGQWNLTVGGPALGGFVAPENLVASGQVNPP